MERTDLELVAASRAGDEAAFELLYHRYDRRLFGYLLRLTKDRARAEDLLQEVFMTVLDANKFKPQHGAFGGFIFKVARNRALTALRDQARRDEKARASSEDQPVTTESLEAETGARALLGTALEGLTVDDRDALILKAVGGLTYREIADLQAVPEGTVKSRLHTAIKRVRRFIQGET